MKTIICSACLLGKNCRYDGGNNKDENVVELAKKEYLIPVCPEQLGGLSTPRKPAGIYGIRPISWSDILFRSSTVRTVEGGEDVTKYFVEGARAVLKIAKAKKATKAIMKQSSPSCGCGRAWFLDAQYQNHLLEGDGVTTLLLKKNGIKVISEEEL